VFEVVEPAIQIPE